jgi:hypothetical protein
MAMNAKIITGLNNPDGSQPSPPVLRQPSGIEADLRFMQSVVPKIIDQRARTDANNRAIENNKNWTKVAIGAQIAANEAAFKAEAESLVKSAFAYYTASTQQAAFYTRPACLLRAVANAPVAATESMGARLARETADQLTDEAALAASNRDPVAGGLIMIEVSSRTPGAGDGPGNAPRLTRGQRDAINQLLATIPTDAEKVQPMLLEFEILWRETSIASGARTPTAKIALALLKQGSA